VFGEASGVKFNIINLEEFIDFLFGEIKFTNLCLGNVVQHAGSSGLGDNKLRESCSIHEIEEIVIVCTAHFIVGPDKFSKEVCV